MGSVRTNTEMIALLPEYVVVKRTPSALTLRCARDHCGGTFIVQPRQWLAERRALLHPDVVMRGRSCPYCMAVGAIPKELKK